MIDTNIMDFHSQFEKKSFIYLSRLGGGLFFLIFGVLLLWTLLARLDGGAYAVGKVIVKNKTQTVQHLEGGVITQILKRDGAAVEKGDTLLILSDVSARSEHTRLEAQLYNNQANILRLEMQKNLFKTAFTVPDNFPEKIKQSQKSLYDAQKAEYFGQLALYKQKKNLVSREYQGLLSKNKYITRQLNLEKKMYKNQETLVNQGFKPQNLLLEQELKVNELEKEHADIITQIATTKRRITEIDLEINQLNTQLVSQASDDLKSLKVETEDLIQRLTNRDDILRRTQIMAPISGVVTDLKFNTIGGVVPPAADILAIVPKQTQMIIQARINPQDINSVGINQRAKINFKAYRSVHVPMIDGVVTYVSADTMRDQVTGRDYYEAHIVPDTRMLEKVSQKVSLQSGMPADITIITGERTPFDYFISPLRDSFQKSFTEE